MAWRPRRAASRTGGQTPSVRGPSMPRSSRVGVLEPTTTMSGANLSRSPDMVPRTMPRSSGTVLAPYGWLAVSA